MTLDYQQAIRAPHLETQALTLALHTKLDEFNSVYSLDLNSVYRLALTLCTNTKPFFQADALDLISCTSNGPMVSHEG